MKTFNKKGDRGETSLLFGVRVPKSDPHCEAYGTIDEAVSTLGLARALSTRDRVKDILLHLQKELFIVGAELATPVEYYPQFIQKYQVITEDKVQELERLIDELENAVKMPHAFIIPGDCAASATLDMARTVIRRAERRVVNLKQSSLLPNEEVLRYLNRVADLLYTLARYEEKQDKL